MYEEWAMTIREPPALYTQFAGGTSTIVKYTNG